MTLTLWRLYKCLQAYLRATLHGGASGSIRSCMVSDDMRDTHVKEKLRLLILAKATNVNACALYIYSIQYIAFQIGNLDICQPYLLHISISNQG